jgi:hypothetical protein
MDDTPPARDRPSDAAFARARDLIANAMCDLAERDLEVAELLAQTGQPPRKPHNSPQAVQIEQIETDPKPA